MNIILELHTVMFLESKYFNECLKTLHNNSILIFDDINLSSEMKEAWLEIIEHPKVSVSINTYFWGFVFF